MHQGITTQVVGSCGFSAAPVPSGRLAVVADYLGAMAPALTLRETGFGPYVESFPATSVNVAMQVGHNTVRVAVMGLENRAPTAQEKATMERLVEEALDAGAIGVSSGLFTPREPSPDLRSWGRSPRVAARRGATYATHIRDESITVFHAIREAIEVAERTGARTRIVHVKVSGTASWGGAPRLLDELASARARGVPVDCDHYPVHDGTEPTSQYPAPLGPGGQRYAHAAAAPRPQSAGRYSRRYRGQGLNAFGRIPSWEAVRITSSPAAPAEVGHTIADIAARQGCDPVDALCAILVADHGTTRGLIDAMHEDDVQAFVACPWILVGSDGRASGPGGPLAAELPHPRFYGTFPRILGHYTRNLGLLTLPEAVHKMTGASAEALGLTDRGVLQVGAAADIVVFDPASIADHATFTEPRRYPSGIACVIVNGVVVIDEGAHTGALPGRVLRRTAAGVA